MKLACSSIAKGFVGLMSTIAASPAFMKSGFSSVTLPVRGSSLASILSNLHAICKRNYLIWTSDTVDTSF